MRQAQPLYGECSAIINDLDGGEGKSGPDQSGLRGSERVLRAEPAKLHLVGRTHPTEPSQTAGASLQLTGRLEPNGLSLRDDAGAERAGEAIDHSPTGQFVSSECSNTVEPLLQRTGRSDFNGPSQTDQAQARRAAEPADLSLVRRTDHSECSLTVDAPKRHDGRKDLNILSQTDLSSTRRGAEPCATGTHQVPFAVFHRLLTRYNREELYEKVWTMPMLKLAKEHRVSNVALAKTCRNLHIPVPGHGYWSKKAANRPVPPKPPLPDILCLDGRVGLAEPREIDTSQEPFAVSRKLLARYNRQELYEKVWTMPVAKVAEEYGVSHVVMGATCRKLHIPVPGNNYWRGKAANRPVLVKPPLPEVLGLIGPIKDAEPRGNGTSLGRFPVSRILLARYNREKLYEKVWTMPLQRVAEEYGMSHSAMGWICKSLHIPAPGEGYWQKRAANKPLSPRPPLPEVQIL